MLLFHGLQRRDVMDTILEFLPHVSLGVIVPFIIWLAKVAWQASRKVANMENTLNNLADKIEQTEKDDKVQRELLKKDFENRLNLVERDLKTHESKDNDIFKLINRNKENSDKRFDKVENKLDDLAKEVHELANTVSSINSKLDK